MTGSLQEEIAPYFSFLYEQLSFNKVEDLWHPHEHFGNALLILHSEDFRIRFVRDRGEVFVYVGPPERTDEWHQLVLVLEFLQQEKPDGESLDWRDLPKLGAQLKSQYSRVKDLFGKEKYPDNRKSLDLFERAKAAKLFP